MIGRVGGGIEARYWTTNELPLLGLSVAVGVELGSTASFGLAAAQLWGTGTSEGLEAHTSSLGAEAMWLGFSPFGVGVGFGLDRLTVKAPPEWKPRTRSAWAPFASLRWELTRTLWNTRLGIGPTLTWYPRDRVIAINGDTAFSVPSVVGGLGLRGLWGF